MSGYRKDSPVNFDIIENPGQHPRLSSSHLHRSHGNSRNFSELQQRKLIYTEHKFGFTSHWTVIPWVSES